jgi:predicted homoserine dehydrogenase-like protein
MAAVANACGLDVPQEGLRFPPCGADQLASVLAPLVTDQGVVEVVSSLKRDGRPVDRDLRWGVYVLIEAPSGYAAACFPQYGISIDPGGRYAAMYRPFHLIGLELGISILSIALRGESTGTPHEFRGDVVAVAKRELAAGEELDGEGGYTVWGKLIPARTSVHRSALPIGLANGIRLIRKIAAGEIIGIADVALDEKRQSLAAARVKGKLA